jgi:DnaJ-class molecular chaperone
MDEQKREIYDKYGKEGLREDGGEMDPVVVFKMLFGGTEFEDLFGEIR